MTISRIESVAYGVEDVPAGIRYFEDWGLECVERSEHGVLRHGDRLTMVLEVGGSVLTEHDPPQASSRCGDLETEHVRRDTPGQLEHADELTARFQLSNRLCDPRRNVHRGQATALDCVA